MEIELELIILYKMCHAALLLGGTALLSTFEMILVLVGVLGEGEQVAIEK